MQSSELYLSRPTYVDGITTWQTLYVAPAGDGVMIVSSDDPTDTENKFRESLTRNEVAAYLMAELDDWQPTGLAC